jgi:hypothetical protein
MVSQDIDVSVVLFTLFHLTILYQAWPSSLLVLILLNIPQQDITPQISFAKEE